jgi:hypothetical protein
MFPPEPKVGIGLAAGPGTLQVYCSIRQPRSTSGFLRAGARERWRLAAIETQLILDHLQPGFGGARSCGRRHRFAGASACVLPRHASAVLFALIRVMRLRRILEIGGLGGYSAANFAPRGIVYFVDLIQVPTVADNHRTIQKDARLLTPDDVGNAPLDLLFLDCHDYVIQFDVFHRLRNEGVVTDKTIIAMHDTNLHPTQTVHWAYPVGEGWVHQNCERRMANDFKRMDYDVLVLGTDMKVHGPDLPFRHGLTIVSKFKQLAV